MEIECQLSLTELRQNVEMLQADSHPATVFFVMKECLGQIQLGTEWSEIGTSELDLKVLYYVCQRNHSILEIGLILAKNQYSPLNFRDAKKLSRLLERLNACQVNWQKMSITKTALCEIIELAACGYKHRQSA